MKRCDKCGDAIRPLTRASRERWTRLKPVGPLFRADALGLHKVTRAEFLAMLAEMDRRSAARFVADQDPKWLRSIGVKA